MSPIEIETVLPLAPKLCMENMRKIAEFGAGSVAVPGYDRSQLLAGILHFGVGNFFRAHQATYLDDLFNLGADLDWAILGANVVMAAEGQRRNMEAQDYLSAVIERSSIGDNARVIGSMTDCLPTGHNAAIVSALAEPAIRIVSMTITEGGYFINAGTGEFDPCHPAIRADAAQPDSPTTVFGLILAGLRKRRENGVPPFTVLSCDNLIHNGAVARTALVGLAALSDPEFAKWVHANVACPSGMVDRITPYSGDRERQLCREEFGIDDAHPVVCEPFRQWVLEDNFPAGRPALEKVGVQFVPDVRPYENMKLRILNAGHALIAYVSALLGIQFVHESMENPLVFRFFRKVMEDEILPSVPPVTSVNIVQYLDLIEERFANPKVADTIRRLCFDGANRIPKFIHPSIRDQLNAGGRVTGLALYSALWCRYNLSEDQEGASSDPAWARLHEAAVRTFGEEPMAWLEMEDIYGDIGQSPVFRLAFSEAIEALKKEESVEKVLRCFVFNGEARRRSSLLPMMELTECENPWDEARLMSPERLLPERV